MTDYFLADDLSGALDAAAGFHRAGLKVRVVLDDSAWDEAVAGEVVGLTTETRNAAPGTAAGRVRDAMDAASRRGAVLRYKKIDSTLRGPVAAELGALLDGWPGVRVLFAPANPPVGRTVSGGVLRVHGVPVADTDFGRDPGSPLRTSVIGELLAALPAERVWIPDTLSEKDLAEAVATMNRSGEPWVGVGSGGLAKFVVGSLATRRALHSADERRATPPATLQQSGGPVLMVAGSAHPANRGQLQQLVAARAATAHEIDPAQPRAAGLAAAAALARDGAAILHLPEKRIDSRLALEAVVEASDVAVQAGAARRLFATGGETAYALCRRLGIRSLEYLDELEPGMALARGRAAAEREGAGTWHLAVKPGGFGDAQTWVRALRRLQRG